MKLKIKKLAWFIHKFSSQDKQLCFVQKVGSLARKATMLSNRTIALKLCSPIPGQPIMFAKNKSINVDRETLKIYAATKGNPNL